MSGLIKLSEWLARNRDVHYPHRGVVVQNTDPKQMGRVKATIAGLIEGSIDNLPWIYPERPLFLGGSSNAISFSVPEVDSEIAIGFPFEDIYFPFYKDHWPTPGSVDTFSEDYPESYGVKDSTGTHFKINKKSEYTEFLHSSGMHFTVDKSGNVEIWTPAKVNILATDAILINSDTSISITSTGAVTIQGVPIQEN